MKEIEIKGEIHLQFECSGRIIEAHLSGITPRDNNGLNVGYDNKVRVFDEKDNYFYDPIELTDKEKKEIAHSMIIMWAEFGGIKITHE